VRVPQERGRRETSRWLSDGLEETMRSLTPILQKRGSRRLLAGERGKRPSRRAAQEPWQRRVDWQMRAAVAEGQPLRAWVRTSTVS